VEVEGLDSAALSRWLLDEWRIVVTPILHQEFQGIRVSPHVYTRREEIDRFVRAMRTAIRDGIPV
jgi:selenocysteine lyase/cysteine desulfurase